MVSRTDSHAAPSPSTRSGGESNYQEGFSDPYEGRTSGFVEPMTLTESQREILEMLDGSRPAREHVAAEDAVRGFGVDVAFATLGAVSILAGIVLLFFFAAFGSILLVLGAILCAVAFEHVALSDLNTIDADELAYEGAAVPVAAASSTTPA